MANKGGLFSDSIVYCTALYLAAQNGHRAAVKFITELPVAPTKNDMFKFTALFLAAKNDNLDVLEYFARDDVVFEEEFADDVAEEEQSTADDATERIKVGEDENCANLFEAAEKGNVKRMQSFLNIGVGMDSSDVNGNTALHIAASNNHADAAEFLIERGADLKCKNNDSNTPMHLAAMSGSLPIVKKMLEKGITIDIANSKWNTPMHLACWKGRIDVVDFLIKLKANINARNKYGDTPLHLAVEDGSINVVRKLLENGSTLCIKNNNAETVLSRANNQSVIDLLVQRGIDIHGVTKTGESLLHHAAKYDRPVLAEYLIKKGLDVDKRDNAGFTPLLESVAYGRCKVIEILLKNGADIHNKGGWNYTMLGTKKGGKVNSLFLASNKHYKATEILLENRARVNARTENGETALMCAANEGQYEIVQLLLKYGANKLLKCSSKKIALDYAQYGKHQNIVNLLTEWKD